jgi:hypothetical protein
MIEEMFKGLTPESEKLAEGYSFSLEYEVQTSRGVCWGGVIRKDGEDVFSIENDGQGGCNTYYPQEEAFNEFVELSKKMFPDATESEDILALWLDVKVNGMYIN